MNQREHAYFLNFDPYEELHFKVGEMVHLKELEKYKALGHSYLSDDELLNPLKIKSITDDGKQVRLYYDGISMRPIPIEWIEPV